MLASHIREILRDKALVLSRNNGRSSLREKSVMTLEIDGIPSDLTIVNMRRIGSLSGVKDGEWKQICDFLLLFKNKSKDFAIFLELKKTLDEGAKQKGKEQLRRSLPFLEYFCSVSKIHNDTETNKPIVQYAVVGERISSRLDKQSVKPMKPPPSENYKDISVKMFVGKSIDFRELLRK